MPPAALQMKAMDILLVVPIPQTKLRKKEIRLKRYFKGPEKRGIK